MTAIDSTNDQNTMCRVIYSYIYTVTIKIRLKLPYLHCYNTEICKSWRVEA